jgi:hypothetical protein
MRDAKFPALVEADLADALPAGGDQASMPARNTAQLVRTHPLYQFGRRGARVLPQNLFKSQ